MTSAEVLLHPVRMRILAAFLGDRKLTTADLRAELPDVPPASLYRHLTCLIDAGLLDVVAERKVRGTLERTYVKPARHNVSPDELAQLSREDRRRVYLSYVAALLADIDHYLEQDDVDLHQSAATFRIAAMWLTDEETNELASRYVKLLQPYLNLPATPDRTRRILRTIVLPGTDSTTLREAASSQGANTPAGGRR